MSQEEQAAADAWMEAQSEGESSPDGGLFAPAEFCWGGIIFRWSVA